MHTVGSEFEVNSKLIWLEDKCCHILSSVSLWCELTVCVALENETGFTNVDDKQHFGYQQQTTTTTLEATLPTVNRFATVKCNSLEQMCYNYS